MKIKVILVVLLLGLVSCKKDKKNNTEKSVTTEKSTFKITDGKNCFKEVIENKVKKGESSVVEKNELIVNLTIEGNKVSGDFDYLPYKEELNKGNFVGTLNGNVAKAICVFTQNGKTKKEEVIFKVKENNISILGGEKEEVAGVWKFKDASKGFYMNEIPRINCN